MKLRHAVAAYVNEDQYLATIGGKLLGLDKTIAEMGLLSCCTLQVVERLRGGGFSSGKGGFGRPVREECVPIKGEWQCRNCLTVRCWPTRNTCFWCGCPRGVDRVASVGQSPGFTVSPLGRVAATRGSTVNPTFWVSPPRAGVGGNLGGKGNGAGRRSPQAAGVGGGVHPVGGLSPRAPSDDLLAPLPVGEVRSSKKVTFSDGGFAEALKAVDLLGSVWVGLGVDLEALRSQVRSPSSTQLSHVAPTGRLLAQEYHKRTKKMEQLQKKLQAWRGRVSRATEELEGAQCALAAMEEEEKLLESEVEDLRRRIAEEREGRMEEREERFSGSMEVTETAVEGGVASKKKVKKIGKGKAPGGKFTGNIFLRKTAKTLSRSDMERIQRTWRLLLDEKRDVTIDEEREGEDLELDAEELAITPVDSPSHSCG